MYAWNFLQPAAHLSCLNLLCFPSDSADCVCQITRTASMSWWRGVCPAASEQIGSILDFVLFLGTSKPPRFRTSPLESFHEADHRRLLGKCGIQLATDSTCLPQPGVQFAGSV